MKVKFFFLLLLYACQIKTVPTDPEMRIIGKYKTKTQTSYEILNIANNHLLTSEYSTRYFNWMKFQENGSWKITGDTLEIVRIRHDSLKNSGFPEKQKLIIADDKLYILDINYKGKLFNSEDYFEKE